MSFLHKPCGETVILIALSVILLSGFFTTRITKRLGLPNVSAYIITGILISPHLFNIIPEALVKNMDFVSDIALAFIAFGVGRFFKKETVKKTGSSVVLITLFESLLAGALVAAAMYFVFRLDFKLALLLGAIATATAPASTVMTINQYHARGEFVDMLLQIVALDDVVCLLAFSVAASVVDAVEHRSLSFAKVGLPVLFNVITIVCGALFAVALNKLLWPHRSKDNRLIITIALLLGLSGLCSFFDISPLLACMTFGAVYINIAHDKELYNQLNVFVPPVMLLFFVVSGMNLDLNILASCGMVGVAYFLIRIIGKYIGTYVGCLICKTDAAVRDYLGVALIPQAGVAIGLAYLSRRILPDSIGNLLMTIILASSVLYELIGPACAKFALIRSGAIKLNGQILVTAAESAEEAASDDFLL